MNAIKNCLLICASGLVFIGLWLALIAPRAIPNYQLPNVTTNPATNPGPAVFAEYWISQNETQQAHSANIAIASGIPVTLWYGGTEEGHADVALFMATFDNGWTTPVVIADRASLEAGLNRYIRKIGNPSIHAWPDGGLGVFFVSVSVGGWAASSINYMETPDLGTSWSQPRRLVTSPFLNVSTLVRAPGLQLEGGTLQLPVYHEFLGKFSEVLHLSRSQAVLNKTRISRGTDSLQPAIASMNPTDALAMLRYAGDPPGRVLTSETKDAGLHWTQPTKTDLPNPGSAVALLNLGDGKLLLALNDTEDGRHKLSLALRHGSTWKTLKVIEEEIDDSKSHEFKSHEFEFSYPSLALDPEGFIHLVYTWNQRRIKHIRFNYSWLIEDEPGPDGLKTANMRIMRSSKDAFEADNKLI